MGAGGSVLHPLLMHKSPTSLLPAHLTDISFIDEDPHVNGSGKDLSKPVQETRI